MHDFISILLYLVRFCVLIVLIVRPRETSFSQIPKCRGKGQMAALSAYQRPRWPLGSPSTCYTVQNPCKHPTLLQLMGFPPLATHSPYNFAIFAMFTLCLPLFVFLLPFSVLSCSPLPYMPKTNLVSPQPRCGHVISLYTSVINFGEISVGY